MSPVFMPPVVVAPEVRACEADILREEGAFHVRGIYFANASDADTARRVEAERRVERYARAVRLALTCPWCNTSVSSTDAVELGGRNLHPSCAKEYDALVYDTAVPMGAES